MIETARKEDLFLDKKLIIPENKLDAIRIMALLHPVVGDQPTHEKDQPNTNNPILDLACTIANIHEMGIGVHADLRKIQNEPPEYYFGKGFMSGISSLKGNGILAVFGQWRDASGKYAIKQFFYTDIAISYRNALDAKTWSGWIDVLTSNSSLDYNKLLNVPITSTLSDDKTKIASIFTVNQVNRAAVNAQKTANTANANAVDAMNEALKKMDLYSFGLGSIGNAPTLSIEYDISERLPNGFYKVAGGSTGFPSWKASGDSLISSGWGSSQWSSLHLSTDNRLAMISSRNGVISEWAEFYSTANTKPIKGFLRVNGSLIPLTEDQLTSTLGDYKDRAASIYVVNQLNRDVVIAQKTANTANANAVEAMNVAQKKVLPEEVASEYLKTLGAYLFKGSADDLEVGSIGLYAAHSSTYPTTNLPFPGYNWVETSYLYRSKTRRKQIAIAYTEPRRALRVMKENEVYGEWAEEWTTYNTTNIKGFLRVSGNLIPLTTDQLNSDLKVNRSDLVASAKSAYDANINALLGISKADDAQKTANTGVANAKTADDKAVKAQARADAAFSRVKPITEGGHGATTAAQGRKNMGHGDASTRNVAASMGSNGNTLVPLSLLQDQTIGHNQKWHDVTDEREYDTEYVNDTGRTIFIIIDTANQNEFFIDGVKVGFHAQYGLYLPIPPGSICVLKNVHGGVIQYWGELK
ncbi:hypothetical protein MMG00_02455 [Ignatzschineria rhizosphaerae]|uniref:Tail fiber protein n=1 Tax=Ignatzschineria rhizosphaerae TaxID=2923279 RepID=A0ABY3X7M5_9GAMM|nr:hypothetical protein [Ignatzschineria rhizosphaerae]UNM96736.1 hypothetical protein MMG00_02455 [Ignatzschineria rhizosphaerae]